MTDTNETTTVATPDTTDTASDAGAEAGTVRKGPASSAASSAAKSGGKSGAKGGLAGKLLPELKQIAGGLGIRTQGLKKAELVAAIQQAQSSQASLAQSETRAQGDAPGRKDQGRKDQGRKDEGRKDEGRNDQDRNDQDQQEQNRREERNSRDQQVQQDQKQRGGRNGKQDQQGQGQQIKQDQNKQNQNKQDQKQDQGKQNKQDQDQDTKQDQNKRSQDRQEQDQQGGAKRSGQQERQKDRAHGDQDGQHSGESDDEDGSSRRNRRRRGRDRTGAQAGGQGSPRGNRNEPDLTVLDDDVLTPAAGILDVLDNYAFVRTSGYLPGTDDVYVSMSMVRKFGLRRGDAVSGQVRQPREGERREKFNPLVQIDSINGGDPESAKQRPEYGELTPVHPTERLRMETAADDLVGRTIDLVAPIGKGQRGLIVAPARSGNTSILKSVAASVTANNPETHLMVVLIDERPEEVTDFQRSVRGEVVSSTFDRPAADHVTVAELAIERATRLVELGHDVVLLLDGLTRLTRAYNLSAPSGGRVLASGIDAAALHPVKRFFGAARNLENGGSLTILATVRADGASTLDAAILEEFAGTANMELRLQRGLADKGLFPAIDATASGTRHEDLLMSPEELAIVEKLRRSLGELDVQQALELLRDHLGRTKNNIELLTQVKQSTSAGAKPTR